jgi:N utilization substance protein B
MARRRAREFALQALYLADMDSLDAAQVLVRLWRGQLDAEGFETKPADAEEVAFAEILVKGALANQGEIDGLIETASTNWRLVRMPVVDRNILRLASFEMIGCEDVPATVSINEAVELAKRFGDKDSRAFVNGILDRIAADLGKGGRKR